MPGFRGDTHSTAPERRDTANNTFPNKASPDEHSTEPEVAAS
jgi:hypothetical protein